MIFCGMLVVYLIVFTSSVIFGGLLAGLSARLLLFARDSVFRKSIRLQRSIPWDKERSDAEFIGSSTTIALFFCCGTSLLMLHEYGISSAGISACYLSGPMLVPVMTLIATIILFTFAICFKLVGIITSADKRNCIK
jgi:hypothetical protein